jgi:hypothetical protein
MLSEAQVEVLVAIVAVADLPVVAVSRIPADVRGTTIRN